MSEKIERISMVVEFLAAVLGVVMSVVYFPTLPAPLIIFSVYLGVTCTRVANAKYIAKMIEEKDEVYGRIKDLIKKYSKEGRSESAPPSSTAEFTINAAGEFIPVRPGSQVLIDTSDVPELESLHAEEAVGRTVVLFYDDPEMPTVDVWFCERELLVTDKKKLLEQGISLNIILDPAEETPAIIDYDISFPKGSTEEDDTDDSVFTPLEHCESITLDSKDERHVYMESDEDEFELGDDANAYALKSDFPEVPAELKDNDSDFYTVLRSVILKKDK